ncbi:hypothetical protein Bbelb_334340 [Branchiostoma belcheri]|nr:hypothetical protein Bbelb_334340 [Branchiostoma belcheri]
MADVTSVNAGVLCQSSLAIPPMAEWFQTSETATPPPPRFVIRMGNGNVLGRASSAAEENSSINGAPPHGLLRHSVGELRGSKKAAAPGTAEPGRQDSSTVQTAGQQCPRPPP